MARYQLMAIGGHVHDGDDNDDDGGDGDKMLMMMLMMMTTTTATTTTMMLTTTTMTMTMLQMSPGGLRRCCLTRPALQEGVTEGAAESAAPGLGAAMAPACTEGHLLLWHLSSSSG